MLIGVPDVTGWLGWLERWGVCAIERRAHTPLALVIAEVPTGPRNRVEYCHCDRNLLTRNALARWGFQAERRISGNTRR
jgi:hypothetical protein